VIGRNSCEGERFILCDRSDVLCVLIPIHTESDTYVLIVLTDAGIHNVGMEGKIMTFSDWLPIIGTVIGLFVILILFLNFIGADD